MHTCDVFPQVLKAVTTFKPHFFYFAFQYLKRTGVIYTIGSLLTETRMRRFETCRIWCDNVTHFGVNKLKVMEIEEKLFSCGLKKGASVFVKV